MLGQAIGRFTLDSHVEAGGANIPAEEAQLLMFARLALSASKDPDLIIILDEPSSNMDAETDFFMTKLISEIFEKHTLIIIVHRLETI